MRGPDALARLNKLRAGVLGANDGIVSVAALVIGVAAAHAARTTILTAGVAGLIAGAVSMASGEYVSVSTQRDTEKAMVTAGEMARTDLVKPWDAAVSSAVTFTFGALLPMLAMLLAPTPDRLPVTFAAVLIALVITGSVSARLGETPLLRPTIRTVIGGAIAMAFTYGVGTLSG